MTRDQYQRRAYTMRRMSLAVDRMIRAKGKEEKAQAGRWAAAWGAISGIRPFRSADTDE